ncbi:MAG: basic amino acid ABC transporter substrate-binding protein [Oscillospiraceae bacterium]|nr:basic amino acid ABC transporter substrate-binding protein [Oscillospiraceae bacterium]
MCTAFIGCGNDEADVLVMATNAEFPPYEFYSDEEIVGIDVDIARIIAEDMGCELVIEDMAFDSIIDAVESGKADIGMAGITVSEDRLKEVDFSDIYAEASQAVIVKEGSDVTSLADLVGKRVGVQLGTTGDDFSENIEDASVERYNRGYEAIQALDQGKVDAVVIDREFAEVYVSQNGGLAILDESFTDEEYAICVAKGNTKLLEKVNASVQNLKDSGKLREIVDKYINAE